MSLSGGNAGSLIDGKWEFGSEWEDIFENISSGIEDYGMPAFSESLSEGQIEAIMDFMESLMQITPSIHSSLQKRD